MEKNNKSSLTPEDLIEAIFTKDYRTLAAFGVRGAKRFVRYTHAAEQQQRAHVDVIQRELIEVFKRMGQAPPRAPQPDEPAEQPRSSDASEGSSLLDELNEEHRRIREEREALRRRRAIVREQIELEKERRQLEAEEAALNDLREGRTPTVATDDPPPPIADSDEPTKIPREAADATDEGVTEAPRVSKTLLLVEEALGLVQLAEKANDAVARDSHEKALEILRRCSSGVPFQEAIIRDLHAKVLFKLVASCQQKRRISQWQEYLDELLRVSMEALGSESSADRAIRYAHALEARGDFAFATENLDEAETIFVAAQERLRSITPTDEAGSTTVMETLIHIGRRLDAIKARRAGGIH